MAEAEFAGSGHFSLEPKKALAKLAHYALPRPTDWALKLVQAAVAGGAQECSARLHLTRFDFEFLPQPLWTRRQLVDALCDPEHAQAPGLNQLRAAIWDCFGHQRPFRLATPHLTLHFDGRWLQEIKNAEATTRVQLQVSLGRRGELLALHPEVRAGLQSALRVSCPLCPIPFTLDGRRVEGLDLAINMLQELPLGLVGSEGNGLRLSPRSQLEKLVPPSLRPTLPHPDQVESVCVFCYHPDTERQSILTFVLDGVLVGSTALPGRSQQVSARIYCSADGMTSELSGLRIVRNRDWDSLRESIPRNLQSAVSRLQTSREELMDSLALGLRHQGNLFQRTWARLLDVVEERQMGSEEFHRKLRLLPEVRRKAAEVRDQLTHLQRDWPGHQPVRK